MAAVNYDITIEQGATFTLSLLWKTSGGTPIDLTGYTARMQIRSSVSSTTILADLTSAAGITLGGVAGTIDVEIPATQTATMTKGGVYDLELVNGSVVTRFVYGNVSFSKEVTR